MAGTFFLVDGTALAYRSHFAFLKNPLTNAKGQETSATFGYVRALLQLLRDEQPAGMAVAFDVSRETFRKEMYPAYKATREKAPPELKHQYPWIKAITEAMGIPILEREGFEADDLIGAAARKAVEAGFEVCIVSGDKDMLQLVGPHIKVLDTGKRGGPALIDAGGVVEKFGVAPERVTDLLGLMGDSSDNVPGVPLIGPKKAAQLIRKFGSLEAALEQAPAEKPSKATRNLIEFADQARLSKELVTLRTDLEIDLDFARGERDNETLGRLFDELDFSRLRTEIAEEVGRPASGEGYRIVTGGKQLEALVEELNSAGFFVFDTETTGLDPRSAGMVGIAFSWQSGKAVYLPWSTEVAAAVKPVLEDPALRKAAQNIKYDAAVLRTSGIEVRNLAFDTMVASYLLESERSSHNLDAMALRHLGIRKTTTEELIGKGRSQISMAEVELEEIARYAGEDADCAWRLVEMFGPRLDQQGLRELFDEVEMPLVPVLLDMEWAGIKLDADCLKAMGKELEDVAHELEVEIHDLAGEVFNVNSPKQLGPILFEKLRIHEVSGGRPRKPRRTRTGGYSTDARALEPYAAHPIVDKLLEFREVAKLKSTYIDALPQMVHPKTGRIHTTFHQTVAATGRLASSNPNLQNIPVRTELGRRVRRAFVADEGCKLLSADYSQVELRLMAHMSGDAGLTEVYRRGGDIHAETAARMFGVDLGEVTRDQRTGAKAINFGILYGMGAQRLSRDLKITLEGARSFLEAYFREFPGVREFQVKAVEMAREQGYVTTLLGRRRVITDIATGEPMRRASAENMAKNTPLQGTAADLIKIAMIRIHKRMREEGFEGRMLLQVHDELVFEAPAAEVEPLSELVRTEMEGAMELSVPLVAEVGVGDNWLEAH